MRIDELPQLAVTAVIDGQWAALLTRLAPRGFRSWVAERWLAYVYVDGTFVRGRFMAVDASSHRCRFQPDLAQDVACIRVGEAYPFLTSYWGERAELVLLERPWQHARFDPSEVNHEHCAICWETLSPESRPDGYVTPPDIWICEACHRDFVIPRSLAFIQEPEEPE
jgi:hypothetical protein